MREFHQVGFREFAITSVLHLDNNREVVLGTQHAVKAFAGGNNLDQLRAGSDKGFRLHNRLANTLWRDTAAVSERSLAMKPPSPCIIWQVEHPVWPKKR